MKLGKVQCTGYVVDVENPEMVRQAKAALYEDLMNAVKYEELGQWIDVEENFELKEEDIPEFLIPKCEECNADLNKEGACSECSTDPANPQRAIHDNEENWWEGV